MLVRLRVMMLCLVIMMLTGIPRLDAEDLPGNIQAALIMKILEQDQNLAKGSSGSIMVAVVADKAETAKDIVAEFSRLKEAGAKVRGKRFDFCQVQAGKDAAETAAMLSAKGAHAAYIAVSSDEEVPAVIKATQAQKILSMTGLNAGARVKSGVTVGLALENQRPSILINPVSTVKEGRSFSVQFLALVKMVK